MRVHYELYDDLPLLAPLATMREAVVHLAERRGIAVVVDDALTLHGVVTTGDLTRLMEKTTDIWTIPVSDVMTKAPRHAMSDELGSAVVFRMQHLGIMSMPVVDGGKVVGVIHLHDLMRSGAA